MQGWRTVCSKTSFCPSLFYFFFHSSIFLIYQKCFWVVPSLFSSCCPKKGMIQRVFASFKKKWVLIISLDWVKEVLCKFVFCGKGEWPHVCWFSKEFKKGLRVTPILRGDVSVFEKEIATTSYQNCLCPFPMKVRAGQLAMPLIITGWGLA